MIVEKDKVYTFKLTNADEVVGKIVEITDVTGIPHNGCKPPKKRRV
jgi:ribosomal protein S11